MKATELTEKWSKKYKDSIDCSNPKGFSQKAHCAGRKKKTNEDTQQLNEAFPLLVPALATAVRLGAPVVSRLLSREGAKQVAKGVAKNAGKAALATGKAVVKNPGKTAAAYGAYEIWDTVNSAINFLEDIGLDDALVPTVAKVIVRYGIPAAAVIAALYGGKKLYDYLKSENSPENQEIIDAFEKEYGITESDLVVNRTQLVSYIKDAIIDWVETEQDVDRLADLLRQTVGQQIHSRGNKFVITREDIDQAFALLKPIQEAAGVGIVTKQNATADVPVGGEYQNVKKLFPKKRKKKSRTTESQQELEEGVGSTLAKLGLVGAVAAGGAGAYNAAQDYKDAKDANTAKVAQAPAQDKKDLSKIELPTKQDTQAKTEYKPFTSNKNEIILAKHARDAGIKGIELASFMSQMAHESENFSDMIEDISHKRAAKKYGSGKIAKILGNKSENDAIRFKGRGYIQLTGRWNYEWMEKELGIDLTSSWSAAQRAADPDIAADIAVAYWKKRVQSKVNDFTDVRAVTRKINPGMHGLESRQKRFEKVAGAMGLRGDGEA